MGAVQAVSTLHLITAAFFFLCCGYQILYLLVPLFVRRRPHQPTRLHRYAILIAARNEEAVLPHLLASIAAQDYPAELVTTFVVADNCTDRTADVARDGGAVVHVRNNTAQVGKGYALAELLAQIDQPYDAYLVFDADNLLAPDFLTQINRTFSDGYGIVTGYRNAKNYGDNWISAGYGLWFLREARQLADARMRLGLSCTVNGTGFGFTREVLARCGGWHYFLLSEDTEFSLDRLLAGERIGYCHDAIFYDEQPTEFRQSWRQRMRWARGYLQVFGRYAGRLLRGVLTLPPRKALSCLDVGLCILPALVCNLVTIVGDLVILLAALVSGEAILPVIGAVFSALPGAYLSFWFLGLCTTVTEWRRINASSTRKLGYLFTFPLFMLTYIPISIAALFCRVEWRPITHKAAVRLEEITRK